MKPWEGAWSSTTVGEAPLSAQIVLTSYRTRSHNPWSTSYHMVSFGASLHSLLQLFSACHLALLSKPCPQPRPPSGGQAHGSPETEKSSAEATLFPLTENTG